MAEELERQTRKDRIDPELKWAGWKIVDFNPKKALTVYNNCAIKECPTGNGPADYALCVNGKILGVVEAKKVSLGPQNVLTQAERYSKGAITNPLNFRGYHVPFLLFDQRGGYLASRYPPSPESFASGLSLPHICGAH
jgi:type I restriction enzyme, R subunit